MENETPPTSSEFKYGLWINRPTQTLYDLIRSSMVSSGGYDENEVINKIVNMHDLSSRNIGEFAIALSAFQIDTALASEKMRGSSPQQIDEEWDRLVKDQPQDLLRWFVEWRLKPQIKVHLTPDNLDERSYRRINPSPYMLLEIESAFVDIALEDLDRVESFKELSVDPELINEYDNPIEVEDVEDLDVRLKRAAKLAVFGYVIKTRLFRKGLTQDQSEDDWKSLLEDNPHEVERQVAKWWRSNSDSEPS